MTSGFQSERGLRFIDSDYIIIKLFNIQANFIGRRWLKSIRSFTSHRVHRELRDFFNLKI